MFSFQIDSTKVLFPVWRGPNRKKDFFSGRLHILCIMIQDRSVILKCSQSGTAKDLFPVRDHGGFPWRGRRIDTSVPRGARLLNMIFPPWDRMIPSAIGRPSPHPSFLVLKKGWKILETISSGTPTPV